MEMVMFSVESLMMWVMMVLADNFYDKEMKLMQQTENGGGLVGLVTAW